MNSTMVARYLLVWLVLAVVATTNGIVRQATYGKYLPDLAAHQISTFTAIIATSVVVWLIHRVWPLESALQAWIVGVCWLLLTIAFEFGFGHFVAGHSWERLFADYNLIEGRIWSLFLVWVLVLPTVVFMLASRAA